MRLCFSANAAGIFSDTVKQKFASAKIIYHGLPGMFDLIGRRKQAKIIRIPARMDFPTAFTSEGWDWLNVSRFKFPAKSGCEKIKKQA
jgi:hypothetical protein